ncbi:hypothetical protein CWS43_10255 [Rahnella sp. AA]|uniref:hypothetical protein n=1 Tax=Rahnella sp. AA TaxID=2057180 RepID=UPI000C34E9C1|nr:hypothetical protein [Rahnella sp. AA]PKE31050.1 hypothetical protein CWS43_10255 [Rahnella sp. AA]
MQNNMVIKWVHRIVTVVLLLLVASYVAYQHYTGPPYDDALFKSQQLNENTWVYVTKYQGGGATVSEVYRYYLSGNITGDPIKILGAMAPFLTSDSGAASVTKIGRLVTVRITGRIFDFTNSVLYTSDGTEYIPSIELFAYPPT